jgi:hypothetical protein
VLGDPLLDLAQRLPPGCLGGELDAELGLVARSAEEHDEVAGDGEGGVAADVLLDEREGEVDAGGDTGGGGDVSVADVDGVGGDLDRRVVAGQLGAVRPVGGRPAAVQEARLGEQDRAGADRDQAPRARAVLAQPGDDLGGGVPGALAARDEQGVRGGRGDEGVVGDEGEAAGGTHGRAVQRGRGEAVGPRCVLFRAVEDLQRTGDVEALHTVEEDDQDSSHVIDS